jgi:solute carrier family 6 GABA transporter-like protein 1
MQYISGPILAIVLSFAYPKFTKTNLVDTDHNPHMIDPIMIYGFSMMHLVVPFIILGFLVPSWFNFIIPREKEPLGTKRVAPMETFDMSHEITRAVSEENGVSYQEPMVEKKR